MKIAFLNDRIYGYANADPRAVGGSERQKWLLARALASSGWTVCVGIRQRLRLGERRTIDGVEFHGIMQGHYLLDWYRYLSSMRPDWLYWRGASHLLGPLVQMAHVLGVRTIFAAAFDTDVHPCSALTARQRWWPLYAWGLSKTERLFVQHGRQLEELPSRWRPKAFVVRSITDTHSHLTPHSCREPYVAWVGMLRQPKRPDLLIEIAKRLPEVKYVVCGGATTHRSPSGYSQSVIGRLRGLSNIEFRGQVAPDEAERVIAEAAVLLCTSDQEGFPNTFLQAWSYGTPVVTLQVDPDSVIKRFDLGAVTGMVEATVEQLQRLLRSPDEREGMAARAREYIAGHHSAEVVVKAFNHATVPSDSDLDGSGQILSTAPIQSHSLPSFSLTSRLPVVADTWYGYHYPNLCEPFEPFLKKNFPAWVISLARRFDIVRGWLFFLVAHKHSSTLTSNGMRGATAFFFLEALLGKSRKHLILLEFIQPLKADSQSILKRSIYHAWLHWILKRALKKSLLTAHVLTDWERSHYGNLFDIPEERFVFIPWPKRPLRNDRFVEALTPASAERSVVSSGCTACDWETLLKAAEKQDWHLTIICSRRDLPRVRQLNRNGLANVLCDIPREDHQTQVEKAAVYVLSLTERERSSGHVRISDATKAGTPIVATAVKGIQGYIDDGETGLLVPPADVLLLRAAVNRLLADVPYRRALARNAFDRAASHTREDYMERIGYLIRKAIQGGSDTERLGVPDRSP